MLPFLDKYYEKDALGVVSLSSLRQELFEKTPVNSFPFGTNVSQEPMATESF